jgi:hypothetical protein
VPSRLPPDLRERHAALYDKAVQDARGKGWNPSLDDES